MKTTNQTYYTAQHSRRIMTLTELKLNRSTKPINKIPTTMIVVGSKTQERDHE